jgi:hypothetical protein
MDRRLSQILVTSIRLLSLSVAFYVAAPSDRGFAQPAAPVADAVSVRSVDGRTLSGVIDARTDDRLLWLRREESGVVLVSPVAWDEIATATLAGADLGAAALRDRARELASTRQSPLLSPGQPGTMTAAAARFTSPRRRVRVRNLEIVGAVLANLDRDVEPDGIEVTIAAVGDDGEPLAVRGTLRAELYGERRPLEEPGPDFDELARWSERVRPEDFIDGVATYELPFRTTAPEWEFDLLPDAVLTVQLGAAGHGNFAASTPIVVRPLNPLRDDLQHDRGTRFLPTELHGSPPLGRFGPQHGRWLHWTW